MVKHRPFAARHLIAASLIILTSFVVPAAAQQDEFLSGQSLDDLWIHINSRDWSTLRATYRENTFYPCDVEWRTVKVRNAACRSRGNGSRSPIKPGLEIEFDRYVSGQRFLGLRSLVLDNLWQDPSMLRERLAMRLFRRMGVAAPRESHVRLFIGGTRQFAGLYAAVEPIDGGFLDRELGDSDGYLYEFRWRDEYHFEDLGADLAGYAMRFEPRTRQGDPAFALYDPVRELIAAMNERSLEELESIFDLRGFIRYVAIENYLAEWDGLLGFLGLNNFYLYRSTRAVARLLPWDKDTTFADVNWPSSYNVDTNILMRRVWADAGYRALYLQTLRDTADAAAFLNEELAFMYAQIAATAIADPYKPESNESFVAAVERLVDFARTRPSVVRRYLDESPQ